MNNDNELTTHLGMFKTKTVKLLTRLVNNYRVVQYNGFKITIF